MPLYLREADVVGLLSPLEAAALVAARLSLEPAAQETVALRGNDGRLELTGALEQLGAGLVTLRSRSTRRALLVLTDPERGEVVALLESGRLTCMRGAATAAAAATALARPQARSLGVLGAGQLAAATVQALRAALPLLEQVVVHTRDRRALEGFCAAQGATPAEYNRDAAEQEIVVTATGSRDPVLRGEWLRPGALVCALGATGREARELDNSSLERASFVCCDGKEVARQVAGDLAEPVERSVLDWLEVHELGQVLRGEVQPRHHDSDIVVFVSAGLVALDLVLAAHVVEQARAAGRGVEL